LPLFIGKLNKKFQKKKREIISEGDYFFKLLFSVYNVQNTMS